MFRLSFGNFNHSKTEFIKNEFYTDCNEVIDIHPYAKKATEEATDGEEKIETRTTSSSSGFLNNNQIVSSSGAEEPHRV